MPGHLLLISGSGRSGTSTLSGTLHHLGLHVPGPYLGANRSNPKGFFESRWSVDFHNAICRRAAIHIVDSRPDACERVAGVLRDEDRVELAAFLERSVAGHPQAVVKDPRSVWTQQLWTEVVAERGIDLSHLSMLRHPAQVVGSRLTHYSRTTSDDVEGRHAYAVLNLARWINVALSDERSSRGRRRAFVRYDDLLGDWRAVARRLRAELGLEYAVDVDSGAPCAVDDFIDVDLQRHAIGWSDLPVPPVLVELAEEVWQALLGLDQPGGTPPETLDALAQRYRALFDDAAALAQDVRDGAVRVAARSAAAEERERVAAGGVAARPVGDVSGRDLMRVVAGRAVRRLRR